MSATKQPLTPDQAEALEPYAAGAKPDDRGEWEIYCPVHNDSRRSCSVNVHKGVWYCHAGCGGGSVRQLVLNRDAWVAVDGRVLQQVSVSAPSTATRPPSLEQVEHWHKRLRREATVRNLLADKRGFTMTTMRRARIGWNGRHYTLPVFSPSGQLVNVRRYDPNPRQGFSKMWNTRGMGKARLYPVRQLDRAGGGGDVLLVEGEWDALLAIQHGHLAVTRTDGAGKPWHDEWTEFFVGLNVYLCYDADKVGAETEAETREDLREVCKVYQCELPYELTEKRGRDLSDYLLEYQPRNRHQVLVDLKENAV